MTAQQIDLKAVEATACHWLEQITGREADANDPAGQIADEAHPGMRELSLSHPRWSERHTVFSIGVEAGIGIAVAVIGDPLGNPTVLLEAVIAQVRDHFMHGLEWSMDPDKDDKEQESRLRAHKKSAA